MRRMATAAAVMLLLGACGTSTGVRSGGASSLNSVAGSEPTAVDTAPSVSSVRTSVPPSSATPTTASPTTVTSTTNAATTSVAATTMPPVTPTTADPTDAWTRAELPPEAFPPCCEENRRGSASPPLTAEPAPLADGVYSATRAGWSPTDPGRMLITVKPFGYCNTLETGACSPTGPPYADDEIGIDEYSGRRTLSIPLDRTTSVGLAGYVNGNGDTATATGADLAALMGALAQSYERNIAAPLRAGTPADEIVADLSSNPRDGFDSDSPEMGGGIVFSFGNAPHVLFQLITDYQSGGAGPIADDGTAILVLTALKVEGGKPTLYFYAGFYS